MVSSAQILYPSKSEEEEEAQLKEEALSKESEERSSDDQKEEEVEEKEESEPEADPQTGQGEESEELDESDNLDEFIDPRSGRPFSISPEEFCGNPYEQYGDLAPRQALGKRGEDAAVRFLIDRGYEIVRRNWFCRFGEADIIARDPDGTLCFVEVKTRKSIEAGLPEESISSEKKRRYERIALAFMMVYDDWEDNTNVRFDAIGICVTGPSRAMLRHHKGFFDASF